MARPPTIRALSADPGRVGSPGSDDPPDRASVSVRTRATAEARYRLGVVATSAGDGLEPFIEADDIADVAAALLVSSDHAGTSFDLSGSQPLSFAAVAEVLSDALGRRIVHLDITDDEFVAGAVAAGVPADYATMLASLFGVIRNGWSAHPSDGVERVLGRPGRSFEQWAATSVAITRS